MTRAALVPLVALALAGGVLGGLARVGVAVPATAGADWLGHAALFHAALMVCAFMGTVIAVERAVALKLRFAWFAPAASALAGAALVAGAPGWGRGLLVLAASVFAAVNIVLVQRQRASHTWLLLLSALAWLVGNLLFAAGAGPVAVVPWWFAFLVVTIAAERLEMTRLMRRRPGAHAMLYGTLVLLAAGAALSGIDPFAGGVVFGAALVLLAAWLLAFDIARRTVHADGLTRFMAVCLLGGYGWLALAGVAWAATAAGWPARDFALHALGLGFIVSMMMGHAPVILPAVTRIRLLYGGWFYLPLAALHLSLLVRFLPAAGAGARAQGALYNALALAFFIATMAGAALAWRRRHPSPPT